MKSGLGRGGGGLAVNCEVVRWGSKHGCRWLSMLSSRYILLLISLGEVGRFQAREDRLRANDGWPRGVNVLAFNF